MSSPTNSTVIAAPGPSSIPPAGPFALWSGSYDAEPNPLLGLEARYLKQLLPSISGLNVVDLGCGTGRWLEMLAPGNPASMVGIDNSAEMLAQASTKLGRSARLHLADCAALPLENCCADLILISFVASYIKDIQQFAREVNRIARAGASIFVSDLHPDTIRRCNWKRGFRFGDASIELRTCSRSWQELASPFRALGLRSVLLLEIPFGQPEEDALGRAGKHHVFRKAASQPAIYILQLELPSQAAATSPAQNPVALTGSRIAIAATEAVEAELSIEGRRVSSLGLKSQDSSPSELDLTGYLVLPGLINSHDHLEFGLFPNLGHGPYDSAESWAGKIQQSDAAVIEQYRRIPKPVHRWWGAVRNLLSGVTTVCHHNPLTPDLLSGDFPVRTVRNFGWAHSLAFEQSIVSKCASVPNGQPFVVHAAEGCDDASREEIFELDRLQVLNDRTVLVHGLALDKDGISLLNRRSAAVVWCPSSNHFLFGRTHTREFLDTVQSVVLGSDSPLTSAGDLLDEIQLAQTVAEASSDEIYNMLLSRPPQVFRLSHGEGKLRPGGIADLIAVADHGDSPQDCIAGLRPDDIHLVVVGGRVHLVSDALIHRLPPSQAAGLHPLQVDGRTIWLRGPVEEMFTAAANVLGPEFSLGKKRIRYVDAN